MLNIVLKGLNRFDLNCIPDSINIFFSVSSHCGGHAGGEHSSGDHRNRARFPPLCLFSSCRLSNIDRVSANDDKAAGRQTGQTNSDRANIFLRRATRIETNPKHQTVIVVAMLAVNTLLEITEIARAFRRFAFWDYFVKPLPLHCGIQGLSG